MPYAEGWTKPSVIPRIPPMSQNPEYGLRAMLTNQPNAEVWDQPPGAIDGFDLQEAAYQPRRKLADAVERADAVEANILVKPIVIKVRAVDVVPLAQIHLGYRNLVCCP